MWTVKPTTWTCGASVELNATAASVLGFLHDGPQSGWDLVAAMELQLGDFWNVTRSQIYRELKALTEAGYITPGEVAAREKRPYSLTEDGRASFAAWVRHLPGDDIVRVPLLLTLYFADRLDEADLTRFVAHHRAVHSERLAAYRELAAAFGEADDHRALVVDYGVRHEEAVLAWMDGLPWG